MKRDPPQWIVDAFACPVCGKGMHLTISHGMCCPWVPAHTGLIRTIDWRDKAVAAMKEANRKGWTRMVSQWSAIRFAKQYLKSNRKYFL